MHARTSTARGHLDRLFLLTRLADQRGTFELHAITNARACNISLTLACAACASSSARRRESRAASSRARCASAPTCAHTVSSRRTRQTTHLHGSCLERDLVLDGLIARLACLSCLQYIGCESYRLMLVCVHCRTQSAHGKRTHLLALGLGHVFELARLLDLLLAFCARA
jgi:hypothetical protein